MRLTPKGFRRFKSSRLRRRPKLQLKRSKNINISKILKLLPLLILLINTHKFFILFQLSKNTNIYDYDLINYYEPAAENFLKTFMDDDFRMTTLSAQVTPIFPLYLTFFNSRRISLFICLFLTYVIMILVYLQVKKLSSHNLAIFSVLLLSVEPSFYALSFHLSPEILFSFFLVAGFYFAICQPFSNVNVNQLLMSLLLGISALIRPIVLPALLVLSIFWLYYFIKNKHQAKIFNILILLVPSIIWSVRNLFVHGFFNLSSISATNLYLYEGVPALAEDKGLTFEQAKEIERNLKLESIGSNPSVIDEYDYDRERGLELILEHPIGLIKSHFFGIGKILFGIYKSKFRVVLGELYQLNNGIFLIIIFFILGAIVLSVWLLFCFGITKIISRNFFGGVSILLIIVMLIIPASGQIAYARFRAPIAPLICLVAALGVHKSYTLLKSIFRSKGIKKLDNN
jgi:4-amino-4-deoxy-L-arabinose transferase-like glycosyltransferase